MLLFASPLSGCFIYTTMISDGELLRRYVEEGSEPAFTELVHRHVNMVYLAALRRVGRNAHAAEDVTQAVFTALARKARSLRGHPSLAGWLYTGTRFAAAQAVRTERRRRAHEEEAHAMREFDSSLPASADGLEPFLDEVMDLLNERDRHAVLLHFFEGRTFAEVGAVLSLSADAARMRVTRALERMRAGLARRGVASSAGALATVLAAQSAPAAPASLAFNVASHALSHAGASSATVSLGARLIQAAKSSSVISWTGTALVMGMAGVAFYVLKPADPAAAPVDDRMQIALARPDAETSAQAKGSISSSSPIPANRPGPPAEPSHTGNRSAAVSDFGQLSVEEKNILARLWSQRNLPPPPLGGQWGLRIGPKAPNFKGQALLWEKGLVNVSKIKGVLYLNEMGVAFCEAHADEIDAYQIPDYKKIAPGR